MPLAQAKLAMELMAALEAPVEISDFQIMKSYVMMFAQIF